MEDLRVGLEPVGAVIYSPVSIERLKRLEIRCWYQVDYYDEKEENYLNSKVFL